MSLSREEAFSAIEGNIRRAGYHLYLVSGGATPRYGYTIGLLDRMNFELIFAGGSFYTARDVEAIIDETMSIGRSINLLEIDHLNFKSLGTFSIRLIDNSWASELLLGAYDYHKTDSVPALQIWPDEGHMTLDVPNMSLPWSADREPVWKWLREPWLFPVPEKSVVFTNLDALNGRRVTEVMRWEAEEWEMFAGYGPDVEKKDARAVPLGTLLGIDSSLNEAVGLEVGKGLWREDSELRWHKWN